MPMRNVVFRADASVKTGTGHVIRCLTLADALQRRAVACHFISREHTGHLLGLIRQRGHTAHVLPATDDGMHASDWETDCEQVRTVVRAIRPDWLIVDHYELGEDWEHGVRSSVRKLLAIDDLGRSHQCDLLLDQNFANPRHQRYNACRAAGAEVLIGPRYALLRPEFAQLRPSALRRREGALRHLLVTMGGSDPDDETGKVLAGLQEVRLEKWTVDVIVGGANPNRGAVEAACARLPSAQLHVDTACMGELMAKADCAICAGGSTTWERCCLGLPALVTVLSPDQLPIAESLAAAGVHALMGWHTTVASHDYAAALMQLTKERLRSMSAAAARICDGLGAERVAERLQA